MGKSDEPIRKLKLATDVGFECMIQIEKYAR